MSDVISDASFVNKDSTKKLKSFQPLIGEALNTCYDIKKWCCIQLYQTIREWKHLKVIESLCDTS